MNTRRKTKNRSPSPSNTADESDDEQLTIADSGSHQEEDENTKDDKKQIITRSSLRKKKPNPALDALVEESDEDEDDTGLQMIDEDEEYGATTQDQSTTAPTVTSSRPQRTSVAKRNFAEELADSGEDDEAILTSKRSRKGTKKKSKKAVEANEWESEGVSALMDFAFLATNKTGDEDETGMQDDEEGEGQKKGKKKARKPNASPAPRSGSPTTSIGLSEKDKKNNKKRGRPSTGTTNTKPPNRRKLNQATPDVSMAIDNALNVGPPNVTLKSAKKIAKKSTKTNFGSERANYRVSARYFTTQTLDNDFLTSRRLVPPLFGTKQFDTAFLSSIKELDLTDLSRGSRYVSVPPVSDPVVTMSTSRAMTANRRPPTTAPTVGQKFGRCSTHVAIAYYIYYQTNQKRDPTTTAKQLKDKSYSSIQTSPAPQQQIRARTNGVSGSTNPALNRNVPPGHVPPPTNAPFYKYPPGVSPPGTAPPRPQQIVPQVNVQQPQIAPQPKGVAPVNGTFPGYVQPPMGLPTRPGIAPTFNPNVPTPPPARGAPTNIMPGGNFQSLAPTLQAPGRGTFPTGYPYGQPYGTNQQFVQMRPNTNPAQPQKRPHLPTGTPTQNIQPQPTQQPQQRPPTQPVQQSSATPIVSNIPVVQQQPQHIRPTTNISSAVSLAPKPVQQQPQQQQQPIAPQYKVPPQQLAPSDLKQESK